MIWNRRLKFLAEIAFRGRKSQPFASFRRFGLQIKLPAISMPEKSSGAIGIQGPQTASFTGSIVLINLRGCPCDLDALRFFLLCARQPHYFHDKPTFHHMVSVVSNLTREYGSIKRIIRALETVGCTTRAQTFLLLMRIYWCGEMHDMVFEAYEEMKNYGYNPNTYARNILMDALFKIRQVEEALRILEETESPNFLSFNITICNLCRLNDINNVKKVVRRMLMKGYYMNPETYVLMLNCFRKFARCKEALQVLGMMTVLGIPLSLNAWNILIDCFCKSSHVEVAVFLQQKMVEVGCSPNVVTFTSLIKGFFESRMPEKASEFLYFLQSKGCFPDLVLCNVLIHCLSKVGQYQDALEVFFSMRERRLTPDVYTYSSLISTLCLSGQYVLLPYLTSGLAVQPDLVVCNCLLNYFCKAGYPRGAVEFYDDMIERGFTPDKYSLAGVLSALCRLGRMRDAVKVYRGIIRTYPDVDAHIHTIMISKLIQSGCLNGAMRLFRKAAAEKYPLDVMAYNVAIDGLISSGQMGEAYDLFYEMKKIDLALNQKSYNLILLGFCKSRDVNMVKHVMKEMFDRDVEINPQAYKFIKSLLPESLLVFNNHVHELRHST